jgi:hypothetical protein
VLDGRGVETRPVVEHPDRDPVVGPVGPLGRRSGRSKPGPPYLTALLRRLRMTWVT